MSKKTSNPKKKPHFLSLRYRLMLFMCLASAFVLALVWIFTTQFMQPLYNRYIYNHLSSQVNTVVSIIEHFEEPISARSLGMVTVNPAFIDALNNSITDGHLDLSNVCFDLADSTLYSVLNLSLIHI